MTQSEATDVAWGPSVKIFFDSAVDESTRESIQSGLKSSLENDGLGITMETQDTAQHLMGLDTLNISLTTVQASSDIQTLVDEGDGSLGSLFRDTLEEKCGIVSLSIGERIVSFQSDDHGNMVFSGGAESAYLE